MPGQALSHDWKNRLYADATGGYIQSKDFDGGGGSIRMGYQLAKCKYGTHNLEFDFQFLFEQAKSSTNNIGFNSMPVAIVAGDSTISYSRKVDFDQYPLMLNYRFIGGFGKNLSSFIWYAGAGLGVNIIHYKNSITTSATVPGGGGFSTSWSNSDSDTQAAFIAQAFLGIGYELSQSFAVTFGGKILGTQKYSFGGEALPGSVPGTSTPEVQTDTVHWMVEGGAHWHF